MALFAYEAIREPGNTFHGEIEAEDESAASKQLLAKGYHVLLIEHADAVHAKSRQLQFGLFGGLKRRDLGRLTRDLSTLLKAGMPLAHGLQLLHDRSEDQKWKRILADLRAHLEDGETFSQALGTYPQVFDTMYVNLIRAGEEGGQLVQVLNRLATLIDDREELASNVRMAMIYPSAMISMGCITTLILLTFVVPMFTRVFQESQQALPLPTLILSQVGNFMNAWWWAIFPALAAAFVAAYQYSRTPAGQELSSYIALRIPRLGPLMRTAEIAGFARTLGTLLDNGVTMVNGLAITAGTLKHKPYQQGVQELERTVRDGEPLSRALKAHDLFPDILAGIVAVGENSGTLSESLLQLAGELEQDLRREIKVFLTLLEPAMIVVVGTVVGFIVAAMILPVFELSNVVAM